MNIRQTNAPSKNSKFMKYEPSQAFIIALPPVMPLNEEAMPENTFTIKSNIALNI